MRRKNRINILSLLFGKGYEMNEKFINEYDDEYDNESFADFIRKHDDSDVNINKLIQKLDRLYDDVDDLTDDINDLEYEVDQYELDIRRLNEKAMFSFKMNDLWDEMKFNIVMEHIHKFTPFELEELFKNHK